MAANVTLLYSEDQDETATLIGKLAKSEAEKGFGILNIQKSHELQMMKSLMFVPKMGYPIAAELVNRCKCLGNLVKCSLEEMKKILSFVPSQQVAEYYFFFQRRFDSTQFSSSKIK